MERRGGRGGRGGRGADGRRAVEYGGGGESGGTAFYNSTDQNHQIFYHFEYKSPKI